jgi:uncharacterized protein YdaU (DUF1376 family)
MAEYPYMKLWTNDFIGDTGHLSTAETGAYIMLLMCAWRTSDCSLPDDDKKLARMARADGRHWSKIKDAVLEFWDLEGGRWTNKRLTKERFTATVKSRLAATAGRASALKRNNSAPTDVAIPFQRKSNEVIVTVIEDKKEPLQGSKENKKSPQKKGVPIPDDWLPSENLIQFAIDEIGDLKDVQRETDKFIDYWVAIPGARGRKKDWNATFRNWIRRNADQYGERNRSRSPDLIAAVSATKSMQSGEQRLRADRLHDGNGNPTGRSRQGNGSAQSKLGAVADQFDQTRAGQDEGQDDDPEHDNPRADVAVVGLHR